MLYFLSVTKLLKVLPLTIKGQVLHCLLLHAVFPTLVGGAGVRRFALTSKSFRFGGLLNATSGGLGMACLSLSEVWRIDKCLLVIPLSLVRLGWYSTNQMQGTSLIRLSLATNAFIADNERVYC